MLIYDVNNVIYYTLMQCSNTNKTEASLKIKITKEGLNERSNYQSRHRNDVVSRSTHSFICTQQSNCKKKVIFFFGVNWVSVKYFQILKL